MIWVELHHTPEGALRRLQVGPHDAQHVTQIVVPAFVRRVESDGLPIGGIRAIPKLVGMTHHAEAAPGIGSFGLGNDRCTYLTQAVGNLRFHAGRVGLGDCRSTVLATRSGVRYRVRVWSTFTRSTAGEKDRYPAAYEAES